MAETLRFDNRVVVVTGAGGGLGKAYALEFAKRGGKVVVNDLGGGTSGEGSSSKAADLVVQEIKQAGGVAVANYDSVEFGDAIIKTAIDCFGRVDVVINNAGILRDRSMVKMQEKDWDLVMKVHLKGTFTVTRAAWGAMRTQKYGRIINTSSGSGLYGNFGQANYSAAKLGLHGFTQTVAKEGEKYNILTNTIAPVAATRMTASMFPKEVLDLLSAERIVPLVVCLAHESCQDNGNVYEVVGGWMSRVRWQRASGAFFAGKFSAEDVKNKWNELGNFEGADYPVALTDGLQKVMKLVESNPAPKL